MFHWLLVLSLLGSWITAEAGFDWTEQHMWLGYTALILVSFRLLWGLWGTFHSRFSNFVSSPSAAIRSLPELASKSASKHAGHTPLGAWSVIVLLLLVAIQAGSGLFISDDIFYMGPYNPVVSGDTAGTLAYIHHVNFNVLQAFVALHLLSVLWYAFAKKQNLTAAMISGYKPGTYQAITQHYIVRGLCTLLLCAAIVAALVYFAPEPEFKF